MKLSRLMITTLLILTISSPTLAATKGQRYCKWFTKKLAFGNRIAYRVCMTPYVGTGWGIDKLNGKK